MIFLKGMDLDFAKENVAMISLDGQIRSRWEDVRNRLIEKTSIYEPRLGKNPVVVFFCVPADPPRTVAWITPW